MPSTSAPRSSSLSPFLLRPYPQTLFSSVTSPTSTSVFLLIPVIFLSLVNPFSFGICFASRSRNKNFSLLRRWHPMTVLFPPLLSSLSPPGSSSDPIGDRFVGHRTKLEPCLEAVSAIPKPSSPHPPPLVSAQLVSCVPSLLQPPIFFLLVTLCSFSRPQIDFPFLPNVPISFSFLSQSLPLFP